MKKAVAVVLFGLAFLLLVSLGTWQINRGLQKTNVVSLVEAKLKDYQSLEVIPPDVGRLAYHPAILEGNWIADKYFLLDNRFYKGRIGYEALFPFRLKSGQLVLVNRGWIAQDEKSRQLPLDTTVLPSGTLYPPRKGYTIGEAIEENAGWPKVSLYLDQQAFAHALGEPVSPLVLVLDASNQNSFTRIWQAVVVTPVRHYAYAVQWYGLAIVLLVFGALWLRKSKQP